MVLEGALPSTHTALPAEFSFLDNPYIRITAIVTGIALLCILTPPPLSCVIGGLSLVDRGVSFLLTPLLVPASHLPVVLQLALSIGITVGGYFCIESCKGGIEQWKSFFNPRDPKNQKTLFWGVRLLTPLFRIPPPLTPSYPAAPPILGRTLLNPVVDTLFFDLFVHNLGQRMITKIPSPKIRAISERVFTIAIGILYGFSHFTRASSDRVFAAVINGVYTEFINRAALEKDGLLAAWIARSANGAVGASIATFFSGLTSLYKAYK